MRHFSPQQLASYLKENNPAMIDVREPWEYAICNLDGSLLIPMRSVPQQLSSLNPADEIVVICHHGIRSRAICEYLEHAGFDNVINLQGGVDAWAKTVDSTMATY